MEALVLPEALQNRKTSNLSNYCRHYAPLMIATLLTALFYWAYVCYRPPEHGRRHVIVLPLFSLDHQEAFRAPAARFDPSNAKIILFWNKFFGWEMPYLRDKMEACPNRTCILTSDRRYLNRSSAVVFHVRNLHVYDLPAVRHPSQLYVLFLLESPIHTGVNLSRAPWIDFFNLTWTYRLDSDVFSPFYLEDWNVELWTDRQKLRDYLGKKENGSVIFASNCASNSKREKYVSQLAKHFPVEVIGDCGTAACPKNDEECERKLTQRFKFYLAFENSYCKDYVTEKAIRPFNFGSIPVFLGGANYSDLFPSHSFINVADFDSPKELADHLWFLVENSDLYERYYDWRFNASAVRLPVLADPSGFNTCKLCDVVHNESFRKTYSDIFRWWDTDGACKLPRGI